MILIFLSPLVCRSGECSKCKLRGGKNIAVSPGERPIKRGRIWRWGVVVAAMVVGAMVFLGVEVVVFLAKGMAGFLVASVVEEVAATIEGDKIICSQFLGVGPSRTKKRHQCEILADFMILGT